MGRGLAAPVGVLSVLGSQPLDELGDRAAPLRPCKGDGPQGRRHLGHVGEQVDCRIRGGEQAERVQPHLVPRHEVDDVHAHVVLEGDVLAVQVQNVHFYRRVPVLVPHHCAKVVQVRLCRHGLARARRAQDGHVVVCAAQVVVHDGRAVELVRSKVHAAGAVDLQQGGGHERVERREGGALEQEPGPPPVHGRLALLARHGHCLYRALRAVAPKLLAVARQVGPVRSGYDGAYGALVHARLLPLEHVVDAARVLGLLGEAPPAHRLVRVGVGDEGPAGRRGAQLDNVGLGHGGHAGDLVEPCGGDRPRKIVHDERPREGAVREEQVAGLFVVGDEPERLVHARRPEPGRRQGRAEVLPARKVHGLFDVVVGAPRALGDGLAVDGRDAQAPLFLEGPDDADELPEHAVLFGL